MGRVGGYRKKGFWGGMGRGERGMGEGMGLEGRGKRMGDGEGGGGGWLAGSQCVHMTYDVLATRDGNGIWGTMTLGGELQMLGLLNIIFRNVSKQMIMEADIDSKEP